MTHPSLNQYLVLVDDTDRQWGKMEKLEVHQLGLLHRAFSVFIFNSKGELLIHQRSPEKYHSANLWTNTCCSHPEFGEDTSDAVDRRLFEEIGMSAETQFAFSFIYRAEFENGLIEHEFDHVYIGFSDEKPNPNKAEVKDWKYMSLEAIAADIDIHPDRYTAWFKICFDKVANHVQQLNLIQYGVSV